MEHDLLSTDCLVACNKTAFGGKNTKITPNSTAVVFGGNNGVWISVSFLLYSKMMGHHIPAREFVFS